MNIKSSPPLWEWKYITAPIAADNADNEEVDRLIDLFTPTVFNFTFSVVCNPNENMKAIGFREYNRIKDLVNYFSCKEYNTRMFDPAGQDDLGGGCGQLWYVQRWLKQHGKQKKEEEKGNQEAIWWN